MHVIAESTHDTFKGKINYKLSNSYSKNVPPVS